MNTTTQTEMTFGNEVEEAFADGRLFLIVDKPRRYDSRAWCGFLGDHDFIKGEHEIVVIHVMSKPAGGEIRGYVLMDDERVLRMRLPNYRGEWRDLDRAVMARTNARDVYPEPRGES